MHCSYYNYISKKTLTCSSVFVIVSTTLLHKEDIKGLSMVVQIVIQSPVMTQEKFAEVSGLKVTVVRGQIERGNLPKHKIGRLCLVNVAALAVKCLEEDKQ